MQNFAEVSCASKSRSCASSFSLVSGLALCVSLVHGGGSGLNVAVVVNQRNPDSVELGNYYCEQRAVRPENVFRMSSWTGGNTTWTKTECQNHLVQPLVEALSARGLTNQIDYVLLSMGIPYQVWDSEGVNSTTSLLFYGFKPDEGASPYKPSCALPDVAKNPLAFSEDGFRFVSPASATAPSFLATMITASNLTAARRVVDSGVAGDSSFPTQVAWLARTSDGARSVRHESFDNAIFDARIRGASTLVRTNLDSPAALTNVLGLQTGLVRVDLAPNAFVPGAMADNMTSFGGILFRDTGQTTLLEFLAAGAAGSYGTVIEPCNYPQKFPNPENYFYQARGFSIAECYYMSLSHPYQGLVVAEPLAAPFARSGHGMWVGLADGAMLSGTTNLTVHFASATPDQVIQQVDLFIDGVFSRTLTNVAPSIGNVVSVSIGGRTIRHTVRSGATLRSVVSSLKEAFNVPSVTNATKVIAYGCGDRIELQAIDPLQAGQSLTLTTWAEARPGTALTTQIKASRAAFLDSIAEPRVSLAVSNWASQGDWVQLDIIKTNGNRFTFAKTNDTASGKLSDLVLSLYYQIGAHPELKGPDGVAVEDYGSSESNGKPLAAFSLRARSAGPSGIGIQAVWSGSGTFSFLPKKANRFDENLGDLRPRNHVYVTAGLTNLVLTFPLDTTKLPNGFHEVTAVAYEGNHVRAQTRTSRTFQITNNPLWAEIAFGMAETNAAAELALPFVVTANTPEVQRIDLFSTGGVVASATNRPSAELSVPGSLLGPGLHPFYALVTSQAGHQFRTETLYLRLIGSEPPLHLRAGGRPFALEWVATPGRRYDVLSTDEVDAPCRVRATVTPKASAATWTDPVPNSACRYYQVRVAE